MTPENYLLFQTEQTGVITGLPLYRAKVIEAAKEVSENLGY
jgi:hypothetical protein